MPTRLAACEPCRASKLSCDHVRPACARCRDRDRAAECTYRDRPFKKRKIDQSLPASPALSRSVSRQPPVQASSAPARYPSDGDDVVLPVSARSRAYPNPGYLGSSSHTTFFGHFSDDAPQLEVHGRTIDDAQVADGVRLLQQLRRLDIHVCGRLLDTWLSKGINMALGGRFTSPSLHTARHIVDKIARHADGLPGMSTSLFSNTSRPVIAAPDCSFQEYCANFCDDHARWETLGLFFAALCRAASDISRFESLYASTQQRLSFQRLVLNLCDRSLDFALSVDSMNDMQLVLQYENYIIHTYLDGDQSYASWRQLGDVASSLFALGYHERVASDESGPQFLKDLCSEAFARTYSATLNVSIFLGRPPRMDRRYCRFDFLGLIPQQDGYANALMQAVNPSLWRLNAGFDYRNDTIWACITSLLREDVLDLSREPNYEGRRRRASLIEAAAKTQWLALPEQFRLEGPLKNYERPPVERDFLVGTKLNYLHIFFLLRLALQQRIREPEPQLIEVAADILHVVCEAVLLKHALGNSGTSLVWKVAYHGLAAAGILCLALLNRSFPETGGTSAATVIQDLSVIVAKVDSGALVHMEYPNYALLTKATSTIKSLLDRLLSTQLVRQPPAQPADAPLADLPPLQNIEWTPWETQSWQDFEVDFWANLAEHPFLTESSAPGLL